METEREARTGRMSEGEGGGERGVGGEEEEVLEEDWKGGEEGAVFERSFRTKGYRRASSRFLSGSKIERAPPR